MSVTACERRIVSLLVADVVGSTSIAERLGPERSKFLAIACLDSLHAMLPELKAAQTEKAKTEKVEA